MRKLTLSLAMLAVLLPIRGYPLGLGEIELNSSLNQNLNARIGVISASADDESALLVKLAGREAFTRLGLDRPFSLQQLKFKVVNENGQLYVKVFTKTPVKEPFLSFLLEIDWPQGHLLREYTLLLDPPVYNNTSQASSHPFISPTDSQAQTQSVTGQQQSAQGGFQAAPATQNGMGSERSANTQYQAASGSGGSVDQYRVQRNDVLWRIAERMRPDNSVSVEQMMLALLRRNPEAFIRDNINGVKRGYILRAPSREEITSIARQQAVSLAREHTALWREYSQGAVSQSPASSMESEVVDATVIEESPRNVDGRLSIVGAANGSEMPGSNQDVNAELERLKQDLAMAREQIESEKLEKQNLRSRLEELEQKVQSVVGKSVLEMDDQELAKLQGDLQRSQQVTEAPAEDIIERESEESTTEMSAEEDLLNEGMPDEEPVAEEEIISEESPVDEGIDEPMSDELADGEAAVDDSLSDEATEDVFVDETDVAEAEIEEEISVPSQPVPMADSAEPPAFAQNKPQGFVDSLMNDPKLLGIIGGGLAFVLLLVVLLLKRMRGGSSDDEWNADEESAELGAVSGSAGVSEADDFANIKIEDTSDDTTVVKGGDGLSAMDTTTEMMAEQGLGLDDTLVDASGDDTNLEESLFGDQPAEDDETDEVISEAVVYLNYGMYQQAEELLITAIDQNSDRDDYRLKLMEVYYAAKDTANFEQLAQDVQSRKGEDKAYWDRVIAMGMEVCPQNAMFSGAGALSDSAAAALLPEVPQGDDLGLDLGEDLDLGAELEDDDKTQIKPVPAEDDLDLEGDLESITESIADTELQADDTSTELEFDLGELDEGLDSSEAGATESVVNADLDIDDDFSLDFDASDLGFEEPEEEAKGSGDGNEFDLSETAATEDASEIDFSSELGDDELDIGNLDLGGETLEMDVSDLDLDSSVEAVLSADDNAEIDLSAGDDDDFDISELSEDIDEVSTKLELAKAYIDMGDSEGARSILEEVKAEGSDEQQQEANELLQKAS